MAKTENRGGRYENIKEQNLHDEEIPWVTIRGNKTKPRNNKRERQIPVGRKKPARNSQTVNNERTTVIAGDSIINNVWVIKLAKAVGHQVVIKPFPEATIRDMRSHVVPTIESPDQSCLHVGTNALKSSAPSDVADGIIDLAIEVGNDSGSEIFISELTARNYDYCDVVKAVNKRPKEFCQQNNWKLISHANISSKGLNQGKLHLNREGNELSQRNFVNFLRFNFTNVDYSLVSQTMPVSVDNEVLPGSSGPSNMSNFLPSKRGFKMGCLNFNSLVKHVDELRALLAEFSFDILVINAKPNLTNP